MGNYWSNDDGRLAAMESRILYLERQLQSTTTNIHDDYEHVGGPRNFSSKPMETRRAMPSFHNELKAQLERRRKFIDMDL